MGSIASASADASIASVGCSGSEERASESTHALNCSGAARIRDRASCIASALMAEGGGARRRDNSNGVPVFEIERSDDLANLPALVVRPLLARARVLVSLGDSCR